MRTFGLFVPDSGQRGGDDALVCGALHGDREDRASSGGFVVPLEASDVLLYSIGGRADELGRPLHGT